MSDEESQQNGGGNGWQHEDDADQEDDVDVVDLGGNGRDDAFDRIVGCIEDIVVGNEFQDLHLSLLEQNCHHFDTDEDGECENKLVYTTVFQEYTSAMEHLIESELERQIPGFDIRDFLAQLTERREDLEGDVFEMLFTLTDFLAFKDLFVAFRSMIESGVDAGLEETMCVTSANRMMTREAAN